MIPGITLRRRDPKIVQKYYYKKKWIPPVLILSIVVIFFMLKFFLDILGTSLEHWEWPKVEKNPEFIIVLKSPLSFSNIEAPEIVDSNRNNKKGYVENQIRNVIKTRNVSHYLSQQINELNSVRLEWSSQNLVTKIPPLALIMVTSKPESKHERSVIRKTWKKWCQGLNVKMVFFMGIPKEGDLTSLFIESEMFEDIIVEEFPEDFYLLPIKILRMLRWFLHFYGEGSNPARPKFLIKTDHDVFLHIPNIVLHLQNILSSNGIKSREGSLNSYSPSEKYPLNYMAGVLHLNSKVTRLSFSKYFTPKDFWTDKNYPPYLGGIFYVISPNLVSKILRASFTVALFHLEDVYITGMVANQTLGIELTRFGGEDKENEILEKARDVKEALRFKNNIWKAIAYHGVSKEVMVYLYDNANNRVQFL